MRETQDVVDEKNNLANVVDRRNILKNNLWDITNKYLNKMFLKWQYETQIVPLPNIFSEPIREKTNKVLNDYIEYVIEIEQQKKGVKDD